MHDAGARHHGGAGIARQQGIEQRAAPVAGRGMHHHARGLVDHQQVLVFVDHVDGQGLGLEGLALQRRAHLDAQLVAGLDLERRLFHHALVQLHRAQRQQLLQIAARKFGHQCAQRLVQAQAMLLKGHRRLAHLENFFFQRTCVFVEGRVRVERKWLHINSNSAWNDPCAVVC
ncbi:hypothetical protein D3C86_1772970 [compost metagenome]